MKTVKDVMSSQLITISVDKKMSDAKAVMDEHRIRHLPVVDVSGGIVGILSSKDIARHHDHPQSDVEFFMSSPVISIAQTASIRSAIFKMLENKISAVLIHDEYEIISGIVTTDDLLWYLAEMIEHEPKGVFPQTRVTETLGQVADRLSSAGI